MFHMYCFDYDITDPKTEYYEKLDDLIQNWEKEIVEFKEAKGGYDTDKIGRYFSAISNEANLRNEQYGWLVFGVSEEGKVRHIVGSNYKKGDRALLERFKYELSRDTTNGITFYDIIELYPVVEGISKRVLMFKIPAAAMGIPTDWKNNYYERSGESLVPLKQYKIDMIRAQERGDWSRQILEGATIDSLDSDAINLARQKFKEKLDQSDVIKEVDEMTDIQLLNKLKLMIGDKVTRAGMVLLGNSDNDYLFEVAPSIMWRLYDKDGEDRSYEIFKIPFISVVDKVFSHVRNLTYEYMPDQMTLFPMKTEQYDSWLIRELLNNCIAHTNYQLGGRIYIDEFDDKLKFSNPGNFIPEKVEKILEPSYNPPYYRNKTLADAMMQLHMIDTAARGIRRAFRIQKNKYFPLPDYRIDSPEEVQVTVYGKVIDDTYMHILYERRDLDLQTVFLLDRVQKGLSIDKADASRLRKLELIEGRYPKIFVSYKIADITGTRTEYMKTKGFGDDIYRDIVLTTVRDLKSASRAEIVEVIGSSLPESLDNKQRIKKISNILASLKALGKIGSEGNGRGARWFYIE